MAEAQTRELREETVRTYFEYIRELRNGVEGAPERLRDLWDEDGVFEFAGAPPVHGSFVGRNAIYVLYRNRFRTSGMPVAIEGAGDEKQAQDVALGIVDTEVQRSRALDNGKVVAGWTTVVGTQDGRGFQVAGSHSFTFKDDRIHKLRVVVSPKPDQNENLRLQDLSVDDIGRLALAAWAVV